MEQEINAAKEAQKYEDALNQVWQEGIDALDIPLTWGFNNPPHPRNIAERILKELKAEAEQKGFKVERTGSMRDTLRSMRWIVSVTHWTEYQRNHS